jgi:hypothetical protein
MRGWLDFRDLYEIIFLKTHTFFLKTHTNFEKTHTFLEKTHTKTAVSYSFLSKRSCINVVNI